MKDSTMKHLPSQHPNSYTVWVKWATKKTEMQVSFVPSGKKRKKKCVITSDTEKEEVFAHAMWSQVQRKSTLMYPISVNPVWILSAIAIVYKGSNSLLNFVCVFSQSFIEWPTHCKHTCQLVVSQLRTRILISTKDEGIYYSFFYASSGFFFQQHPSALKVQGNLQGHNVVSLALFSTLLQMCFWIEIHSFYPLVSALNDSSPGVSSYWRLFLFSKSAKFILPDN